MQKRWALIILFVVAGVLRLYNLGYSDYQGDEIKAFYVSQSETEDTAALAAVLPNPKEDASVQFFLEQRKGPMQFLVTALLRGVSNDYQDRALVRLPFALAGLGSVIVFYYLTKLLFNDKVAFYSSIFFATNGFLIAFSRIVQYQTLVIFFGLLAIYLTKKYVDLRQPHFLVAASISLAVSILSHYDGAFFIPIILGLLYRLFRPAWVPQHSRRGFRISPPAPRIAVEPSPSFRTFIISMLLFLILTGAFYVPFVLNIAQSTTDYWAGRISGDVSGKISSSRYLFSVYQPIYVLHVYTILGIVGFALVVMSIIYNIFPQPVTGLLWRVFKIKTLDGSYAPFNTSTLLSVLVWFLIPFVLLEVVVYIPGTHIYTYLIPAFLFVGFAVFYADLMVRKICSPVSFVIPAGVWLLFSFLTLQSYYVFVDHTFEYPWENKKFLIWTFPKPTPIFHLSMFGFPYYRHWDEIGDYIESNWQTDFYTTNERVSISRYHITLNKDGEKAGYYVYIKDPQTFTNEITNDRISAWVQNNQPIVQYKNQNRVVSEIHFVR